MLDSRPARLRAASDSTIPDALLEAILEGRESAVVIAHLVTEQELADLLHPGRGITRSQAHARHTRRGGRTLVIRTRC